MPISIIIPTLNEAENIVRLISFLKQHLHSDSEIIVVDAESQDATAALAQEAGARVLVSAQRGRAVQMNTGAAAARHDILYFIHADCQPPTSFEADISAAVAAGYPIGCYRYKFDSQKWMLKINGFFTRFSPLWCRGGDETLFVTQKLFQELGGYDTRFVVMEEYDFIKRARQKVPFKILPKNALVSARKYDENAWLRVQIANFTAFRMYRQGCPSEQIAATYKSMIKHR